MRRPPHGVLALAVLLTIGCSACAQAGRPAQDGSGTTVVASFYPVWEAASRIAGDDAEVENLTPPGVEPHDVELTSRSVDTVIDADLVLYLGRGFQPAVEDAARDASGTTVDLLDGLRLRKGTPEEEEEHGDESEHTGELTDPHVWLDPRSWSGVVTRIERALAEADPSHADAYARRAATYRDVLSDVDHDYRVGLENCRSRTIVTSHAAFGYLAARYDLEQVPISGISPEAEPSPKRLAEITDLVAREHITTIFTETLVSPRVADTLAREANVETAVLDPIEGLTDDEVAAGLDYAKVMRKNLSTLERALGCR